MKLFLKAFWNSKNISLIISFGIVIFAFIVSRFPFYHFYPVTYWVTPDTFLYFHPSFDIINGKLPLFNYYSPGYPLFIYIIDLFSNKVSTILFFQSLFILFSVLFFIYAVNKSYRRLTILSSILISVYILSNDALQIETLLMSDSLYANFIILFFSQIILTLNNPRSRNFIFLSLITGLAIFIRPAGLFLFVILFILLVFILIKKLPVKNLISLFVPVVSIILLMYFYNLFTVKAFTISPSSVSYLPVSVINYMEPNEKYDKNINNTLIAIKDSIPRKYLETIKTSKNYDTLWKAYYFHNPALQHLFWKTLLIKTGAKNYTDESKIVKQACYNSIRQHPSEYFKFFRVNFFESFNGFTSKPEMFYFSTVPKRYNDLYKSKFSTWYNTDKIDLIYDNIKIAGNYKSYCLKEFDYDKVNKEKGFEASNNKLKQNVFFKIYDLYYVRIHSKLFNNIFWILIYFVVGIISIIKLLLSKMKSTEALLLTILFLMPLLSFTLNSMVEISDRRYSYPCEFSYYLSFCLLFIYFKSFKKNHN